mmetsp:Transcript_116284/g.329517  ORF Transcript_116284/g.329517 Transcript_116284/m.329517 type:complete len:234 (-) Transcript_116284:3141-3842(-)
MEASGDAYLLARALPVQRRFLRNRSQNGLTHTATSFLFRPGRQVLLRASTCGPVGRHLSTNVQVTALRRSACDRSSVISRSSPSSPTKPQCRPLPFASGPRARDWSWSAMCSSGWIVKLGSLSTTMWKACSPPLRYILALRAWPSAPGSGSISVWYQSLKDAVTKYLLGARLVHSWMPLARQIVVTVMLPLATFRDIVTSSPVLPVTIQCLPSPRWSGPRTGTLTFATALPAG